MAPQASYLQSQSDRADLVEALGTYPRLNYCSIGILILWEDGWAELQPTYEKGTVIIRQFVFEGVHSN